MKTYPITDVRSDRYLNPAGPESRPVGNITKIVVHHDAVVRKHDYDTMAHLRSEAAGHYNALGPGLQYHYSIDNVGEIFWVRDHNKTLWHAGNLAINRTSIAIKLDGYFHPPHNQRPTREQYEALKQLLDKLCTQHPEFPADFDDVIGHREASPTACPGDTFFGAIPHYRATKQLFAPADVQYDWPELQPKPAPAPAPQPAPNPAPPIPPTIEISYRVYKAGKQIGAYTIDKNAWNKYDAENADSIKDGKGNDITAQMIAKFNPSVPPPPLPEKDPEDTKPIPPNTDVDELKGRVSALEALVKAITDFLDKIFKWR